MKIRQYIGLSAIFLIIVGIYVYSIIPDQNAFYKLTFFGYSWNLHIAVWLMIPAFMLFLASVAHMVFYSIKNFLAKRLMKKDYDTLVTEIKHVLLGEEGNLGYKTEIFKILSLAVKKMKYNPKSSDEKVGNSALDEIFGILEKIRDGEHVNLKKFRLRSDNELLNQNQLNFVQNDRKSISEILKNCVSLDSEVCIKAFNALLKQASYADIKSYRFPIVGDMLTVILKRYIDKDDKLALNIEDIKGLLENAKMNSKEFLSTAKILKTAIEPDALLELYDSIQSKNQNATFAYLYILFELRLIDKIKEFLENNEDVEFEKFRILLFLRDNGKIVDTDLII